MSKIIDKEIKRKIENNEEISGIELIKYFSHAPLPIKKGLFKKIRQKRSTKIHNETCQYLLDNFDNVLRTISSQQLQKFLYNFSSASHKKELFEKFSNNNYKFVEFFKDIDNCDLCGMFSSILRNESDAHIFFENNFSTFYEGTNDSLFNIQSLFILSVKSPKLRSQILKGLCNCLDDRTLRKEDAAFFLQNYIDNAVIGDNVFFNEIHSPSAPISEKAKSKVQDAISPEDALFLLQTTNEPLFVHNLLKSVDVNSPEITEYLDTHLDHIVQEIGNGSRDSLTIKMIVQELLENENKKPSEIEYYSKGGFTQVYKIGDKILKYGRKPCTPEIPYNSEYFAQPLLRTSLSDSDNLEIYEHMNVGGSLEDMYQLFKALKDQGLVWTDIKSMNIGHVIKENTVHFKGIESVDHVAAGFKEDKEIPIAKPGSVVLLDLDFVFLDGTEYEIPDEATARHNFHYCLNRYNTEKEKDEIKEEKNKKSSQPGENSAIL